MTVNNVGMNIRKPALGYNLEVGYIAERLFCVLDNGLPQSNKAAPSAYSVLLPPSFMAVCFVPLQLCNTESVCLHQEINSILDANLVSGLRLSQVWVASHWRKCLLDLVFEFLVWTTSMGLFSLYLKCPPDWSCGTLLFFSCTWFIREWFSRENMLTACYC